MEATEEVALTTCEGMSAGEVSVCPAETLWSNDGADETEIPPALRRARKEQRVTSLLVASFGCGIDS
jgi:hypothetical protein